MNWFKVIHATLNNIFVISWQSVKFFWGNCNNQRKPQISCMSLTNFITCITNWLIISFGCKTLVDYIQWAYTTSCWSVCRSKIIFIISIFSSVYQKSCSKAYPPTTLLLKVWSTSHPPAQSLIHIPLSSLKENPHMWFCHQCLGNICSVLVFSSCNLWSPPTIMPLSAIFQPYHGNQF